MRQRKGPVVHETDDAARSATKRIPDSLRELRTPWLTDVPPGPLAGYVRFASVLTARTDRRTVVRYASGGSGTIIEEGVDEPTYAALGELIEREYFEKTYDDGAREELANLNTSQFEPLLRSLGITPRAFGGERPNVLAPGSFLPQSELFRRVSGL